MYKKHCKSVIYLILICFLLCNIQSLLHQRENDSLEDKQYAKLNEQQKYLQDNINNLVQDMLNVQKNVSKTPKASDKVMLLQTAIISQRQKIFNMGNLIIPPFSLSKTACLQLTNKQKIELLDKIKDSKQQISSLQKQIMTAPKCDKITNLQKDTQKQLTLLQSIQKTILTQCQSKSILTPTIYQTNIYANGWILGDQHIDDLIEQYYQRNIRYHNITNCPLEKPFFNGQQCMICKDLKPVFNILTRQCTQCPEDQQPDPNLRQCAWQPHFTNFSSVDNWAQDGAPMPVPKRNLVPCPSQKPYYNGKKCQICLMPKYWNIKLNACVQCPSEMIFDINDKQCQKPQSYDLTILQGTRWVTNDCNLTRIVEDRIQVLNLNKTKKYYKICPDAKPFYDGIVCIQCPNQFNIDLRKCVSSPNKTTVYDQNVRCYVQKQSGFETDPRADNYTTKYPLSDSKTPNCKKTNPYYDGIACIDCLDPFPIFDVQSKRCTACDPMQIYNNTQHICKPRQKIYISTYEEKLMATPKVSIQDYHAQIKTKITENPNAVILLCKNPEYSDFKVCLNCSNNQYFNVETKKCQICDGTIDPKTKICKQKAYTYTFINEDSIKRIVGVTTSIEEQNVTITKNLVLHNSSKLCPKNQPFFSINACTNCTTQSFNFTSSQCVPMQCTDPKYPFYNNKTDNCQQCPKNMQYQPIKKKCQPIVYVTNTAAIFYYIEVDNYTKEHVQDQIFALEANNHVITCDASHPYANGTDCIDCAITRNTQDVSIHKPYFNLKSLKCQACQKYDNNTHRCLDKTQPVVCSYPTPILDQKTNKCIECQNGTFWLKDQNKCGVCPSGTNYNKNTLKCETCSNGQIYNSVTKQCQTWVTNVNSLTNNYIQSGNGTKANLVKTIEDLKKTQKVNNCDSSTPFFSKNQGKCVNCITPTNYFNLLTEACQKCDNYNVDTHTCEQSLPRFKPNVEDFYGTIFT